MAAELIEAGVDVNDIYRRLYEHVPIEKLQADRPGAGADRAARRRALSITYICAEDYAATGAERGAHRGDHRLTSAAIEGTAVAAVVRDQADGGRAARKVSLRSTDGRSTSRRSRAARRRRAPAGSRLLHRPAATTS